MSRFHAFGQTERRVAFSYDAPRNAGFFYFFEIRGLTGVNGSDILRLWQR